MHLLVLSAFRLGEVDFSVVFGEGLNAPFGAQCFPTDEVDPDGDTVFSLNAPFGAQCFPTRMGVFWCGSVSMSQCTFWCSVLSDG